MVVETHRDIPQNVAHQSLHKTAAAGLYLFQRRDRDVSADKAHSAADIHANRVGDDRIYRRDDATYWHPHPLMGVGHQADMYM